MESILITGSNGFLGSSLRDFLLKNQHKIFSISHGMDNNNITNISSDIMSIANIPDEISSIYHFAALTDVQFCESNPDECYRINVQGTKNILEIARKNDAKLIFPSTSHVYGIPKYLPINETFPLNPLTIHAKSKVECELMCKQYSELYGLKIIVLRLFSIYGNQSPEYAIIPKIIHQILTKNKISLGNIKTKRDFLHITDFLSAVGIITKSKIDDFSIFNIGSGKSHSIEYVCKKLLELSQKNLQIESNSEFFRKHDVDNLICDNTKLRNLGWSPTIEIDNGLKQVYESLKLSHK